MVYIKKALLIYPFPKDSFPETYGFIIPFGFPSIFLIISSNGHVDNSTNPAESHPILGDVDELVSESSNHSPIPTFALSPHANQSRETVSVSPPVNLPFVIVLTRECVFPNELYYIFLWPIKSGAPKGCYFDWKVCVLIVEEWFLSLTTVS